MKRTAFTQFHEELGAKMVPFAGFSMPVQYEGLIEEHKTVREKLGVFDVSHMGEFWVQGPAAREFVQWITTNDVNSLYPGKVQYTCFPNGKGGIVDDLLVYCMEDEKYLLVVNAANIDKDWAWCTSRAELFKNKNFKLTNESDDYGQLAVQGPLALKAMQKLTAEPVEDMEFYTVKQLEFAGIKDIIFATTGYTGSGGCEIYMKNEDAPAIWKAVFEAGEEFGIKPIGLGARDTLRLEMGFCLYGNDIDDTTSPLEAGLGWITKFVDGNDFIDREYMLQLKEDGLKRRLRGFELKERGIPRQHYEICDADGKQIGEVTSGTMAPSLDKAIGLGYIDAAYTKFGTEIFIRVRKKLLKAEVCRLPFYKEG